MPKRRLLKNERDIDSIVYVVLCIFTLGAVWLLRVIISEAIRKAFKNVDALDAVEEKKVDFTRGNN